MEISFRFCNGDHNIVETSEEIATFILNSRREEENLDRKERYHCCPLFDENDKEIELADWRQPVDIIEEEELRDDLRNMLELLTDTQRRRLIMYAEGLSTREIARREGCDHNSVLESLTQAKKKASAFLFKYFF